MRCPMCQSENVETVEVYSLKLKDNGQAFECLDCGLRSSVVPLDADTLAFMAWVVLEGLSTNPLTRKFADLFKQVTQGD